MKLAWRKMCLAAMAAAFLTLLPLCGFAEESVFTGETLFGSGSPAGSVSAGSVLPPSGTGGAALNAGLSGLGDRSLNDAMSGAGQTLQIQNNPLLRAGGTADTPEELPRTITWSSSYITVSVNNNPVSSGAAIHRNDLVQVEIHIPTGSKLNSLAFRYSSWHENPYTGVFAETLNEEDVVSGQPESTVYTYRIYDEILLSNVEITAQVHLSYPLWVGAIQVTDANKSYIGEGQMGGVSFDPARNVLLLNNAHITGGISSNMPLTIQFSGANTVQGTVQNSLGYGIYSNNNLTLSSFSAPDSLTVTAPAAADSGGIYLKDANLTVGSGANVSALSQGGSGLSAGVHAGRVEVSGGLTATAGNAAVSRGIDCTGLAVKTVNAYAGGRVTAYGGDTYTGGESTGLYTSGSAAVETGANLTAQGKGASGASRGVSASAFSNAGTADCSSGNGGSESSGLYTAQSVTNSGTLTATGGTASSGISSGIRTGAFSVTGGSVNAQASAGSAASRGISAATTVSGGTVIAGGPSGAFSAKPVYSGYTPLVTTSSFSGAGLEADASKDATYQEKYVTIRSRVLSVSPAAVTISVGEVYALQASSAFGYSLRWTSSSPDVQVDSVTGMIKGMAAGSAVITVQAYNSITADAGSAACSVKVLPVSAPPASAEVASVRFDQESVTFSQTGGIRTVKYYVTPASASGTKLTWSSTDNAQNTVRLDVSESAGEFTLTAVGNGSALITATAPNGREATCRVTVSGMAVKTANGQTISGYIDYLGDSYGNAGVWFYDYSDMLRATCTAPLSALQGVYIDDGWVPEVSGTVRNFTRYDAGNGKTGLHFTRTYLSTLRYGVHKLSLSYSGAGSAQRNFYIQSVRDAPRTGDAPFLPSVIAFFASGGALCAMFLIKRRKNHGI